MRVEQVVTDAFVTVSRCVVLSHVLDSVLCALWAFGSIPFSPPIHRLRLLLWAPGGRLRFRKCKRVGESPSAGAYGVVIVLDYFVSPFRRSCVEAVTCPASSVGSGRSRHVCCSHVLCCLFRFPVAVVWSVSRAQEGGKLSLSMKFVDQTSGRLARAPCLQ